VELTISVNRRWTRTGETAVFTGKLTKDGLPWSGQTVEVRVTPPVPWVRVGSDVTDAEGNWRVDWAPPHYVDAQKLPCGDFDFYALHPDTKTFGGPVKMAVAYRTRVRDFTAPDSVDTCQNFTASGFLEYEVEPLTWEPLTGETIILLYDETEIARVTTGADGSFSYDACHIDVAGTYTLKARFLGKDLPLAGLWLYAPAEAELLLSTQLWDYGILAGALAPLLIVGGLVAGHEISKILTRK